MKLWRTIAVEDEAPALRRLIKMIEEHSGLELIETAKTAAEAKDKVLKLKPDLLLLDIQLKDAIAFDMLSEIEHCFSGKIIFITAYDQYAVKAFDYEAIDYLLKPYLQERFNTAVNRMILKNENINFSNLMATLKSFTLHPSKTITVPEGSKNHFIEKEKLQYLTADTYYTHFVLTNGSKMIRISLKKSEEILPDNFIRINKSTIVNKDFIIESYNHKNTAKITMADKKEFYVSEKFLHKFTKE